MCVLNKAEYLEFETLEFNQTFSPHNLVPFQNTQEILLKSFPSYRRNLESLLSPMYMQCTRDVLLYLALMRHLILASQWYKMVGFDRNLRFGIILHFYLGFQ